MQLNTKNIHIWFFDLNLINQEEALLLLSEDEKTRAFAYQFPLHQQRYIAARSLLRRLIGHYLSVSPALVCFGYHSTHKPYVLVPQTTSLQFNLAHSHHKAVFAFSLNQAVGVDIEKIENHDHSALIKRFFSAEEQAAYAALPLDEKNIGFYRLWARNEALVKAIGKGLSIPLSSFSLSINNILETIIYEEEPWHILPLTLDPDYESALAMQGIIKHVSYFSAKELTLL
jgi:4'-phosphopantetheinyl transferase